MFRLRVLLTCAAVSLVVGPFAVSGRGQIPSSSPRSLLDRVAPPAIERGINPIGRAAPSSGQLPAGRTQTGGATDRVGAMGTRYRAGRVIVKFKDGVSTTARATAMSTVSRTASMSQRAASQNFDIVDLDAAEDAETAARTFRARPDVDYAQAAYRVHPSLVPNDSFYQKQWSLPLVDMERAWDIQPAAASTITVAVLDTGVAYTPATMRYTASSFCRDSSGNVNSTPCLASETAYPALGAMTLTFVAATELAPLTRFVAPHDFIWNDNLPLDLEGHGTHVSGTIGQLTNNRFNGLGDVANGGGTAGVAFNVKLMPVKVLDTEWDDIFGAPNSATDDIVALGIRYAADNGAKIINMSLGRTGPANCGTSPNQNGCAPVVEDAIRYAVGRG